MQGRRIAAHCSQGAHAECRQEGQPSKPRRQGQGREAEQQCVRVHSRQDSRAERPPIQGPTVHFVPVLRILVPLTALLQSQPANEDQDGANGKGGKPLGSGASTCRRQETGDQAAPSNRQQPKAQEQLAQDMAGAPKRAGAEGGAGAAVDAQRQGRERRQMIGPGECVQRTGPRPGGNVGWHVTGRSMQHSGEPICQRTQVCSGQRQHGGDCSHGGHHESPTAQALLRGQRDW
mmetsp:Transcript_31252/g.93037  ORF Transcript_31252/g.93037 Transcript_31252/m.93037 type:complete len:233 (-) Transcript_31252:338-1036(-)